MAAKTKKPTVALLKPPPVNPDVAERFVKGETSPAVAVAPAPELPSPPPASPAPMDSEPEPKAANESAARRSKSILQRQDGRQLRRMTVYFPPDLAKRLEIYAVKHDMDTSSALSEIVGGFLSEMDA